MLLCLQKYRHVANPKQEPEATPPTDLLDEPVELDLDREAVFLVSNGATSFDVGNAIRSGPIGSSKRRAFACMGGRCWR